MLKAFPPLHFYVDSVGEHCYLHLRGKEWKQDLSIWQVVSADSGGGLFLPNHSVLSGHPSSPAVTSETQEGARPGDSLLSAGRDFSPKAQVGQGSSQIFRWRIEKLKSNETARVKIGLKSGSPNDWKPQTLPLSHSPSPQGNQSFAFCLCRFVSYR